mgnify:CR=1 FL=1
MSSTRSRIGRQAVLVMALAMLVLSSLPVSPAGAQPNNDARDVGVKVKDFKFDCESFGGTATTRPSATDDDKTIANCSGGELDGRYCVITPTTLDCGFTRDDNESDGPNVNPNQSDVTDLAPTDTSVDQAANGQGQHVTSNTSSDDRPSDNQPQKGKKKDKKRGKHGKGRR